MTGFSSNALRRALLLQASRQHLRPEFPKQLMLSHRSRVAAGVDLGFRAYDLRDEQLGCLLVLGSTPCRANRIFEDKGVGASDLRCYGTNLISDEARQGKVRSDHRSDPRCEHGTAEAVRQKLMKKRCVASSKAIYYKSSERSRCVSRLKSPI